MPNLEAIVDSPLFLFHFKSNLSADPIREGLWCWTMDEMLNKGGAKIMVEGLEMKCQRGNGLEILSENGKVLVRITR